MRSPRWASSAAASSPNALVAAPVLFFFVSLSLLIHQNLELLREPRFLFWNVVDLAGSVSPLAARGLAALPGFWVTVILVFANIGFLVFWVFTKSISVSWSGSKLGNSDRAIEPLQELFGVETEKSLPAGS